MLHTCAVTKKKEGVLEPSMQALGFSPRRTVTKWHSIAAAARQYLQWSTGTGLDPFMRPLQYGFPIFFSSTSTKHATLRRRQKGGKVGKTEIYGGGSLCI